MQSSVVIFRPSLPLFNRRSTTVIVPFATFPTSPNPNPNPKQRINFSAEDKKDGSALRGSDILLALQRATALKKKKKKKNDDKQKASRRREKGEDQPQVAFDFNNVPPINVRSDWIERINELETRIQELKAKYLY